MDIFFISSELVKKDNAVVSMRLTRPFVFEEVTEKYATSLILSGVKNVSRR